MIKKYFVFDMFCGSAGTAIKFVEFRLEKEEFELLSRSEYKERIFFPPPVPLFAKLPHFWKLDSSMMFGIKRKKERKKERNRGRGSTR